MTRVYYLSVARRCRRTRVLFASLVTIGALSSQLVPSEAATPVPTPKTQKSPGTPATDIQTRWGTPSSESDSLKQWYSAGTNGGTKPGDEKKPSAVKPPAGRDTALSAKVEEESLRLLMLDKQPIDLKQIAESINGIRRNITDESDVPILRVKAGTYLYLLGDFEAAANELKTAIGLQPNNAYARAQLAKILQLAGEHHEAIEQFRKSVDLAPNVAYIHFLFAESLFRGGNISEAINEYRRSLTLKQDAEAQSGLSEALLEAGDITGAMKASRQAVSIDPALARAQVALTNALLKSGDQQSSLRTARQAALLNPNMPEAHLALGRCLFTKGDITGAVEEFRQAVSLDPLSFQARNDLGYALYGKGDILSAISEFRLALRLNPRFTEARNNLEVSIHRLYTEAKP